MKSKPATSFPRILTGAIAALLFGAHLPPADGATFTWGNVTGSFSDPTKWTGGVAPTGTDLTDVLIFGGDVGTTLAPSNYIATSDSVTNPFLINQLSFQGTTATPGTGPVQTINGATTLLFGGANASITQGGTASLVIAAPIRLGANLIFAGNTVLPDPARDKATITLNGTLSGNFDITKTGTSTFRFGSATGTSPSDNTWFGALTINDGTIRFNNNAYTAQSALRANPVTLNSATALLTTQFKPLGTGANQDPESSLRMGTLSGSAGTVEARRETLTVGLFDSADMTITTMSSGSFGGTIRNARSAVAGNNDGTLNIRGVGTQTFTGTLDISKDVKVGDRATLVISGNATMSQQTTGAIIMGGGTVRLDNSTTSNSNRLRDGDSGSTGVETIGGGTLSLVGGSTGNLENIARVQLGNSTNSRSGALTLNVTHTATAAATVLNFQSYARDVAGSPFNTVNFSANNAAGAPLALGTAGNNPRITFSTITGTPFTTPVFNGLMGNTGTADSSSVGWATVNGTDFASYGANGVVAVATVAPPSGGTTGTATANVAVTTSLALSNATGYVVNSMKLAPSAAGQSIDLTTTGNLFTNAYLLAGTTDFSIESSGGGRLSGLGTTPTRYFHINSAMLTVNAGLNAGHIVKSGAGTLVLTNTTNSAVAERVIINEGTVRATPGSTLPTGELRFRGGVLEITGGGTFTRRIGLGANELTWSGVTALNEQISQEQGSGGFSAFGLNAIVDLTPVAGTEFVWENPGFVNSGHALLFGSTRADARLTWVDNINLTAVSQSQNYNARHFRAIDNPNSTNDVAVLSGTISGTVRNDFMKSGNGELILSGNNTYFGATLITEGTLRVNGSNTNSFLTDVRDGATLGGSGTVSGVQVENNGTLAPGDLSGNASILNSASLTFMGSGAKLAIEIGGTTAGGNSVSGYDRVNVAGGVSLAGAQLNGSLLNGFTASPADLFFIVINDGVDAVQGNFAQASTITIGAQLFNISYTGNFTGNAATDTFTGGNDIVLQVVPEPGTAALFLLGTLGLGLRRRRA